MRLLRAACVLTAMLFAFAGFAGAQSAAKPADKGVVAKPSTAKPAGKAAKPPLNVAPDAAREQAIADAIAARVPAAEVVWLDVDKRRTLALYREQTTKKPRGAVLLLHGMDANPDAPRLMQDLRSALPKAGWSVLAVQLPVLPPDSPRAAYGGTMAVADKRIQAALAELKARKLLNVAIVGQDLGAALALTAALASKDVRAVVALSLSSADGLNPAPEVQAAIEKLKVPVLDVYGGFAEPAQYKLAEQRAATARAAQHPSYTQVILAGSDDMLGGIEAGVVNRVRAWLNRYASGVALTPPKKNETGTGDQ